MNKRVLLILVICIMTFALCACEKTEQKKQKAQNKNDYKAYIELVNEYEKNYDGCKYDLVYFNADDIPELVAGIPGSFVALYSLDKDGDIHTIMDDWAYGAFGNHGYEIVPKEATIKNDNSDYAGLVLTTSYIKVKDNYQQELFSSIMMPEELKEEIDKETKAEVDNYLKEFGGYYHNAKRITKEEFLAQIPEKEFEILYGEMNANEIIEELTDLGR